MGGLSDRGSHGRAKARVAYNAQGISSAFDSAGELRIIGEHGADADHDGGVPQALGMHALSCGGAGNPARCAGSRGDFAIERHGILQRDIGRAVRDEVEEDGVEGVAFRLRDALVDRDAGCAKLLAASSRDKRIGVGRSNDDACDVRFDDGFGARRLLAGVAAWLEGYVEGCAFGRGVAGLAVGKSGAFRMKIAAACVPAFRDDFAIAHEHGTYERVGVRESRAAARELNGSAHVFDIGFAVCHDCLLLMPRIRAFAEGRGLRLTISDVPALMRLMLKSMADQLAWVWSGWAMDARWRSALASPNSRNPANAKSPETRTFQGS